ncbi:MAG: P-loop NTPase fold protein [Flavobacteriaceae bacterium]|jgi:hypothetical protein|nr:P-loop NTPase fold protein [Flavobacteriaceae bacterium]
MNNKYKFKILREEVETEDFYEDKTHEKIKNSLFELIKNEDEGITIGVAGQWGSGKSTIINLLKKEKDFLFFYFDAWAHEGDPLRRIFLESFINCIKESEKDDTIIEKLEEKRAVISREKRTKTIKVKRATTKLGLWLAITTFLFTIGIALLSTVNYDNLTLKNTGSLYYLFCIGTILVSTPFFVLLINLFCLVYKGEKTGNLSNWAFLQNNSDETITEDIIGEDERSSIEFEKYFKEILEITNSDNSKKIIIVLDNLDRVDAEVSLKIWSTLQTFIQHKNPTSKDYKIFKNIFTLIPYDEESLMKIWENYSENEEGIKIIDNGFAKSFFDKSFQVRIDVPKPIVSNWLGFIDKMIQQAFQDWTESDKKSIKEVIEKTRKNILDNPKPREIKTYLNQVGFLRNHFPEDISTKSIAFYSFKRYLQGKSNNDISEYLLNINKVPVEEINLIEEDTIQEISAIIYGVNKENGAQILLSPKIIDALNNNKPEILEELQTNYKNVFWAIFKKIISDTNQLVNYLGYSTPINTCFKEIHSEIHSNYIELLERYLKNEINYNYQFGAKFSEGIKNTSDLLFKYQKTKSLNRLWYFYLQTYIYQENKKENTDEVNLERNGVFIDTLYHIYSNTDIQFKTQILNIDYKNWKSLNQQDNFPDIHHLIHPSTQLISEISKEIKAGNQITEEAHLLINNCIKSGVNKTEPILNSLNKYFKWNNGNQSGNVFDYKSIELFENLFYTYHNEYDFNDFLKTPELYSVCYFVMSESDKTTKIIGTICSLYFKHNILNIENEVAQNNSYANSYIQNIKNYWQTSDSNNAQFTYDKFKENGFLKYVWDLCKDENNVLCLDILDLMIQNEDDTEFEIDNPFKTIIEINNNKKEGYEISSLVNKLFENSKLEEEILNLEDLELTTNDYVIYEILNSDKSEKIFDKVKNGLSILNNDILKKSLNSNDYLFDILLEIKGKDNNFSLGHILNETLYEFVYGAFLKNNVVYTFSDWQKSNWSKIVRLLDESHFDNFCKRISKLIVDEKENLSDEFFELNDEFISKSFVIELINKEIEHIKLYIQEVLQNPSDINKLKYVEYLFKLESGKQIKFGRGFKDLIVDYVTPLLSHNNEDIRRVSGVIANRFSIKIENQ